MTLGRAAGLCLSDLAWVDVQTLVDVTYPSDPVPHGVREATQGDIAALLA